MAEQEAVELVSDPQTIEAFRQVQMELRSLALRVYSMEQTQRTAMRGWNSFLEHAEMQLRQLFRGKVPAPMLRKLVGLAFQGMEESERKSHAKT